MGTTFSRGISVRQGGSPFQLPWGQHLAGELYLDGGPITFGRTPSRSTATIMVDIIRMAINPHPNLLFSLTILTSLKGLAGRP